MYLPTVFFGITLVIIFWILLAMLDFPRSRVIRVSLLACLIVALPMLVLDADTLAFTARHQTEIHANRPVEVSDGGYVGSNECVACHPRQYSTWHATYHRTMTQVASPETVRGKFDGSTFPLGQIKFRLYKRKDKFWVDIIDETTPDVTSSHEIVLLTGSHHYQVYWYATDNGRNLAQVPFVYHFEQDRWVPRKSVFLIPPETPHSNEYARWNTTCIQCHATFGRPRPVNDQILDTYVAEFGIACEMCHGPGEQHVNANRNPLRRYVLHFNDDADETITNPRRLPPVKSAQICGQCHSIWTHKTDELAMQWRSDGAIYRPGGELSDTRKILRYDSSNEALPVERYLAAQSGGMFWNDGMVRVAGREYNAMTRAPCFKSGELTCFSCHSLHKAKDDGRPDKTWADDLLSPQMYTNTACLQCHTKYNDNAALEYHTHHDTGSSGQLCYNCHMPYTTYGLLNGIRSHEIESPDVQVTLSTGRPNACNLCHLGKTLEWTSAQLNQWFKQPVADIPDKFQQRAASIVWLLNGDAGQRALIAWHMGWKPALAISGQDWMTPLLITTLDDPYDAPRYIAYRSLRNLPGFEQLQYDYVEDRNARKEKQEKAFDLWYSKQDDELPDDPVLMLRKDKTRFRQETQALIDTRDNSPISLIE